jgi:acyl carrier protein
MEELSMDKKTILAGFIKNEIMRNRNARLKDDEDLLSAGILDSLGILQLVAYIDKTFNLQIPDEDVIYENFQSINSLESYLSNIILKTSSN